ncbi:terpenoid cyclases/protein prenyltransferase alpha-alpha toroid [Lentinula aciculospora]|uniref:Terpenoid cyclases/protein prenyltransferase alpha-alpha toroid n=1 Tax=Lentinula aciculospora TaxID=153920 RepID=A0A9W9AIC5_9AGAR|nr:terpenoid cyclases/protein prenyltransferase alpha-alpha toroid [Lentinula aciculospora]
MSGSPSLLTTLENHYLPPLARVAHAGHVKRCLSGLPSSQVDLDPGRMAVAFYCLGSLDLLKMVQEKISQTDRESWREWIWEQQTRGKYGSGFRPSPFMAGSMLSEGARYTDYDMPHIIMTYTALLTLAILRDDFSRLDKQGILSFLKACQREDGSFSTVPGSGETDLRTLYCAFVISHLLNDWSGVDADGALSFIASCRSYEGGYGQSAHCEANGGTTYIAMAAIHLAPVTSNPLSPSEIRKTIEWAVHKQHQSGGFCGRTNKLADACYCFWIAGSLKILGAGDLVNSRSLAVFLSSCQFKFGGISKAPGEHPDPYHTYLSLAALSMFPPPLYDNDTNSSSWAFEPLDPLINARKETAEWARSHIAIKE